MSGDSNGLHPFWFLGDLTLGDGLTLIGSYIQSEKNQSKRPIALLKVHLGIVTVELIPRLICIGQNQLWKESEKN